MFSISIPTFSPYSYNFSGVGDLHGRVCYVKNTVGKKGTTIGNVHAGRSIRAALNVESPPWNDHFIQSLNTPFSVICLYYLISAYVHCFLFFSHSPSVFTFHFKGSGVCPERKGSGKRH